MTEPPLRPARDTDGPAIIALIWSCWSLLPGIRMDVEQEMPELHALATYYANQGGALWVAETEADITGMIAVRPAAADTWEICRLYVHPTCHGSGLAQALLDLAERHAIDAGAQHLTLWSDTRFDRAHRFYEKRSYIRNGPIRVLDDISNSLEFAYAKPVNGVLSLDIAAATSAERRLAEVLLACVNEGAPVDFLPPLPREKAQAFWHRTATEISTGNRVLIAAWRDAILVGTGLLDLATPENQPHRAEVQNVLVHPAARRTGIARRIMAALEHAALRGNRNLLTLDTRAGGAGEALYRSLGWQESGRIPGYAMDAAGTSHDTILFWKTPERRPQPPA
jgi:GNAT superfamily N-acetyltransferase